MPEQTFSKDYSTVPPTSRVWMLTSGNVGAERSMVGRIHKLTWITALAICSSVAISKLTCDGCTGYFAACNSYSRSISGYAVHFQLQHLCSSAGGCAAFFGDPAGKRKNNTLRLRHCVLASVGDAGDKIDYSTAMQIGAAVNARSGHPNACCR